MVTLTGAASAIRSRRKSMSVRTASKLARITAYHCSVCIHITIASLLLGPCGV